MRHTKESISALLRRNKQAVAKGLQTVKDTCGFTFGSRFALDLCDKLQRFGSLTDRQTECACDLLCNNYAAVLARVANEKAERELDEAIAADEQAAAIASDHSAERYEENRNEKAFRQDHAEIDW